MQFVGSGIDLFGSQRAEASKFDVVLPIVDELNRA